MTEIRRTRKNQSGQMLLITLLVVSVAVTIVLSIIGRATTDVAISNQIDESSRAFNAAEAGIEESLKTGGISSATIASGASYNVTRADIGGGVGIYEFPNKTTRGQVETLWLASQDGTSPYAGSSFDICWTTEETIPAIIVSILYKTAGGIYQIARGAYDPDSSRAGTNSFSTPTQITGGCGGSTQTTYLQRITFANFGIGGTDTLISARIQPVYSDTKIAINAQAALPLQGSKFESVGKLDSGVTRKIVVFQQYRSPPALFDYVIYSQGDFRH